MRCYAVLPCSRQFLDVIVLFIANVIPVVDVYITDERLIFGVYYYPERYGTERLVPLNTYFTERFQNML